MRVEGLGFSDILAFAEGLLFRVEGLGEFSDILAFAEGLLLRLEGLGLRV